MMKSFRLSAAIIVFVGLMFSYLLSNLYAYAQNQTATPQPVFVGCVTVTPQNTPTPTVTNTAVPTATATRISPTPTRIGTLTTPVATALPFSTPDYPRFLQADLDYWSLTEGLRLRKGPNLGAIVVGSLHFHEVRYVTCLYEVSANEVWASEGACSLPGNVYFAVQISGTKYSEPAVVSNGR